MAIGWMGRVDWAIVEAVSFNLNWPANKSSIECSQTFFLKCPGKDLGLQGLGG